MLSLIALNAWGLLRIQTMEVLGDVKIRERSSDKMPFGPLARIGKSGCVRMYLDV